MTTTSLTRAVVICAYTTDRFEQMCGAVQSALDQLERDDEIILVIDHNPELLARARERFGSAVKVIENAFVRGLSGARNTGVQHAAADLVVFLDDDAAAEPGWLEALVAPFDDNQVVGTGGHADPAWPSGHPPLWMPDEFLWVVGCSYRGLPTSIAPIRNPIGCNMAFRREAIVAAGGFSSDLGRVGSRPVGGEETDLAIRITAKQRGHIVYVPSAAVQHTVDPARERWSYFASRCYHEGRSKAVLARRVGSSDATASERAYLSILARGVSRRLGAAVAHRSGAPLAQIGALVAGLAITTTGFIIGSVAIRFTGKAGRP